MRSTWITTNFYITSHAALASTETELQRKMNVNHVCNHKLGSHSLLFCELSLDQGPTNNSKDCSCKYNRDVLSPFCFHHNFFANFEQDPLNLKQMLFSAQDWIRTVLGLRFLVLLSHCMFCLRCGLVPGSSSSSLIVNKHKKCH